MTDTATGVSITDFLLWAGVVTAVLGLGIGAIAASYFWPTGKSVVFDQAIASVPALSDSLRSKFEQGCAAHQQGQYRRAVRYFGDVLSAVPNCAEAFHNRGLALANLGDDQTALRSLLEAGKHYDQQGDKAGLDQLKQSLETLRHRRQQEAKG